MDEPRQGINTQKKDKEDRNSYKRRVDERGQKSRAIRYSLKSESYKRKSGGTEVIRVEAIRYSQNT